MKGKFNWKEAEMFERRGSRRFSVPGEESTFNALHKIIKEADPNLEGSEMARKTLKRK